eukprot:194187-Amphidinium_carterae.1
MHVDGCVCISLNFDKQLMGPSGNISSFTGKQTTSTWPLSMAHFTQPVFWNEPVFGNALAKAVLPPAESCAGQISQTSASGTAR